MAPSTSTNTAATAATASTSASDAPSAVSTPTKFKLGFSEIANLFIRLRRHQSRSSLASEARKAAEGEPETKATRPAGPSPLVVSHAAPSEGQGSRLVLTPPTSPGRNRARRIAGSPYSRSRAISSSKANHVVSTSGDEPITHPVVRDTEDQDEHAVRVPLEYTDRFECAGGVNAGTLLKLTRRTILENVENLGANALADEKWDCTICGPKHGSYKVQINYSATATHCTRPDCARPVALDHAKGVPGLMTITKRNEA
ncbi:hypothetical protein EST38_g11364 [Candolleomyces aberdarensis]|uniref:Uncharacterized protein n=1 Tax=Candolleomyces aberdarensis TaxID=2316362 RepID=A0A4Q2D8B2_9AGAR|nr:hypothetical protein EST38_g11364 [Candolleomyces aberdarensis]